MYSIFYLISILCVLSSFIAVLPSYNLLKLLRYLFCIGSIFLPQSYVFVKQFVVEMHFLKSNFLYKFIILSIYFFEQYFVSDKVNLLSSFHSFNLSVASWNLSFIDFRSIRSRKCLSHLHIERF